MHVVFSETLHLVESALHFGEKVLQFNDHTP